MSMWDKVEVEPTDYPSNKMTFLREGDQITGRVTHLRMAKFDTGEKPEVWITDAAGQEWQMVAGPIDLARSLKEQRPEVGDDLHIVLTSIVSLGGGKSKKNFAVQVRHNHVNGPARAAVPQPMQHQPMPQPVYQAPQYPVPPQPQPNYQSPVAQPQQSYGEPIPQAPPLPMPAPPLQPQPYVQPVPPAWSPEAPQQAMPQQQYAQPPQPAPSLFAGATDQSGQPINPADVFAHLPQPMTEAWNE